MGIVLPLKRNNVGRTPRERASSVICAVQGVLDIFGVAFA